MAISATLTNGSEQEVTSGDGEMTLSLQNGGTEANDTGAMFQGKPISQLFPSEARVGWTGFVEWEQEPERKKIAAALLKTKKFTPIPGA